MSESIRSGKSSQRSCSGRSSSSTSSLSGMSTPHKFSSIVNKVESLINKMNADKLNNFKILQGTSHCAKRNDTEINNFGTELSKAAATQSNTDSSCGRCDTIHDLDKSNAFASLDSLNNITDADSFEEHEIIYTDSDDAEIAHITGTTAVQVHRRFDLDQLTDETIREFNEQCSSLSHDLDFENVWNTEEDEYCTEHNSADSAINSVDFKKCEHSCENTVNDRNQNQRDTNNNCGSDSGSNRIVKDTNFYNSINVCCLQKETLQDDKGSNINDNHDSRNDALSFNQLSANANFVLPNSNIIDTNGNFNVSKCRRPSIASSGSMGRMETILEEPTECKISVKEILARFETMNTPETQSKGSSISSGARAAAQTLNVPIERLESRQSNNRELALMANNGYNTSSNNIMTSTAAAATGLATASVHHDDYHEKTMIHQHINSAPEHRDIQVNDIDNEQNSLMSVNSEAHIDNVDRHHYIKQASYIHSGRKASSSQHHQPQPQSQSQQQQQLHHEQHHVAAVQHIDANYMTEEPNATSIPPSVTKFSLLQFALQHFHNDQLHESHHDRDRGDRRSISNRSYAELVKWQGTPIRTPLLRLPNDLAPLALECFECILRYCGDIPLDPELTEVKCVYTVLMHCHKYLALRDEVYCQLMKQTTANRSPCTDSAQRAWRLLSILAAYFGCSDALRPYLMEHLTSAASDRRRSCHGTAAVCLTNLRKTARCGGRKNVPSVEEVTAVSAGRSARRQIYRLPGGAERVVNTRCSTVVADVIAELCALLSVDSEGEQQEFSLYCIVQGDAFTMPLAADEYILDVTTELLKSGQPFYLIFCRSVWHFPLKRDPAPTPLYVEVLFNQVAPDYLEGLLLELPGNGVPMPEVVRDMARIAALLHRAADLSHVPAMKEIKFLLPKPALGIREIRPAQWVGLVQSAWPQVAGLSPGQVKAQFLNVLATWPLFGSSFFAVKRIWADEGPHVEENSPMWRDLILALNRRGVLFLDPNTHETLQHWPFMEVISTRKVRSEDGALFLDMKVGNLMQQRVIRVQTEQAHEISRLVRQYITMAQISQREKREAN